jgi:hypothetical protein
MGICGTAWPLLSRQFGEPWACAAEESIIWIDGPAFTYFLAFASFLTQGPSWHQSRLVISNTLTTA